VRTCNSTAASFLLVKCSISVSLTGMHAQDKKGSLHICLIGHGQGTVNGTGDTALLDSPISFSSLELLP
jgi:hypothetical protein